VQRVSDNICSITYRDKITLNYPLQCIVQNVTMIEINIWLIERGLNWFLARKKDWTSRFSY